MVDDEAGGLQVNEHVFLAVTVLPDCRIFYVRHSGEGKTKKYESACILAPKKKKRGVFRVPRISTI